MDPWEMREAVRNGMLDAQGKPVPSDQGCGGCAAVAMVIMVVAVIILFAVPLLANW